MDELVWTVKPKATQEQRKALINKLPGLLSALNKWLDAIKWQDAERLQFFAELARCHLSIVRAPLELSPERQLELAVEAARQDALRRIAHEQAAAAEEEAPQKDDAALLVDALERGMRLEFARSGGAVRKVKLAWVSPLRSLFIFSSGLRQEAFSLGADKLLEAVRAGGVRVLAPEGVVGRVLTEALQDAVNDPAPLRAAHRAHTDSRRRQWAPVASMNSPSWVEKKNRRRAPSWRMCAARKALAPASIPLVGSSSTTSGAGLIKPLSSMNFLRVPSDITSKRASMCGARPKPSINGPAPRKSRRPRSASTITRNSVPRMNS